jgi:hypothetical protein
LRTFKNSINSYLEKKRDPSDEIDDEEYIPPNNGDDISDDESNYTASTTEINPEKTMTLSELVSHISTCSELEKHALLINGTNCDLKILEDTIKITDIQKCGLDIDSFLWTGETLPISPLVDLRLSIYPNANYVLTTNNHCHVNIIEEGQETNIPIFQIPNFEIGSILSQFVVNIFFRNLRRKEGNYWVNILPNDTIGQFYDLVLRPAILSIVSDTSMSHFPLDFASEKFKCTNQNSTSKHPLYSINGISVQDLTKKISELIELQDLNQFRNFFFHIHAKDLKLNMNQALLNVEGNEFIDLFKLKFPIFQNYADFENGLYDLGIEIIPETKCTLLWNGPNLLEYLKSVLCINIDKYLWCSSQTILGAKFSYSRRALPNHQIVMGQAYMLEKEQTFVKGGMSMGTKISASTILAQNDFQTKETQTQLNNVWTLGSDGTYGVRLEFRMSYAALKCFLSEEMDFKNLMVDSIVQRNLVVCHPSKTVCSYKIARTNFYWGILWSIMGLGENLRRDLQRNRLIHIILFLIKSMVESPDTGQAIVELNDFVFKDLVLGSESNIPFFSMNFPDMNIETTSADLLIDRMNQKKGKMIPTRRNLGSEKARSNTIRNNNNELTSHKSKGGLGFTIIKGVTVQPIKKRNNFSRLTWGREFDLICKLKDSPAVNILQIFLSNIWSSIPKNHIHNLMYGASRSKNCPEEIFFSYRNFISFFSSTLVIKDQQDWELIFNRYFPLDEDTSRYKHLREQYFECYRKLDKEEKPAIRQHLWVQFQKIILLPMSEKGNIWPARRKFKGDEFMSVQLIKNLDHNIK